MGVLYISLSITARRGYCCTNLMVCGAPMYRFSRSKHPDVLEQQIIVNVDIGTVVATFPGLVARQVVVSQFVMTPRCRPPRPAGVKSEGDYLISARARHIQHLFASLSTT